MTKIYSRFSWIWVKTLLTFQTLKKKKNYFLSLQLSALSVYAVETERNSGFYGWLTFHFVYFFVCCFYILVVVVGDRTSRRLCHSRSSPVYLPRRREDRVSSARQENSEEDRSWRLGGGRRFIFQCRIFIFPQCLSEGNELCTGNPRRGEKRWCQVTMFKCVARRNFLDWNFVRLSVFQINPVLYLQILGHFREENEINALISLVFFRASE